MAGNNTVKQTVELDINGQQARNELKALQEEADMWRAKMVAASKSGDTKTFNEAHKELTRVNNELRKMQKAQVDVNRVMNNLSSASVKEINRAIKQMNTQLTNGSIPRGSEQWKTYKKNVELARLELAKINAEGKATGSWVSQMRGEMAKFAAVAGSVIAAATGVSMALSSFRKKGQEKEDAAAQTKALTGLDDESIAWLTKQAETLSTTMEASGLRVKQSAAEIMQAFMLVGSNKPELLADKEALAQVTTETLRLSAASGIDLKESVGAVTGALNQFGEGADQAARYVNVLAAGSKYGAAAVGEQSAVVLKAGVSANMAKLSFEQLIGATETLAEFGIKDELAGTGLKTFLLRLEMGAKETRPSVVGLDKALEALSVHTDDAAWMKKAFGLETFNVAKVLIDNREKIKSYTEAVTDTTTATEQAAITSNTASAKLAQLRNQMNETGIELMQSLDPAIITVTDRVAHWERALVTLIQWANKHRTTIVTATAAIAAYTIAVNAASVADKLKVFWTEKVVTGYKALTAVLTKNPWGLAVAAIATVVAYLYDYNKELQRAGAGEQALARIRKAAEADNEAAIDNIDRLRKMIANENIPRTQRLKLIRDLKEIMPDYNAEIDKEGKLTKENTQAVEDYIKALNRASVARITAEERDAANKEKRRLEKQKKEDEKNLSATKMANASLQMQAGNNLSTPGMRNMAVGLNATAGNGAVRQAEEKLAKTKKQIAEQQAILDALDAELAKAYSKPAAAPTAEEEPTAGPTPLTDKEKQKIIASWEWAAAEAKKAAQEQLNTQAITEKEYTTKVYEIEQGLLTKKMSLYKSDSKEYMELAKAKTEAATKNGKTVADNERKAALTGLEQQHKDRETEAEQEMAEAIAKGKNKTIAQLDYEQAIYESEQRLLTDKMALYAVDSDEYTKLMQEKEAATAAYARKLQESASSFVSSYIGKSDEGGKYDIELQKLEEYHRRGLISEKQYQEAKKGIEKLSSTNYIKELDGKLKAEKKSYSKQLQMLRDAEDAGKISHEDAIKAKQQLDKDYNEALMQGLSTMVSSFQGVMSALSSYIQASSDLEVQEEENKWDAKIAAAEEAGEDTKDLEEQKEAAVAAIKNKYNEKAQKIEIAQAIASGAMAAINAYSSAAAIPYVGYIIAPIAAAAALAATGLQIAAIKKQYEAESAGYYEGGYTGGNSYRREAGVVHEGEFVANHEAVNNPAIRPLLDMIDEAQRTNSVAAITSQDVALATGRAAGYYAGGYVSTKRSAPTTTIITRSESADGALRSAVNRLNDYLEEGIQAYTTVDGRGGIERATKRFNTLKGNKSR